MWPCISDRILFSFKESAAKRGKPFRGVLCALAALYGLDISAGATPQITPYSRSSFFHVCAGNGPERFLERHLFLQPQTHVGDLLAIAQFYRGVEQVAHVVDAAPDFRHAAVDIKKRVDCFHAGAHGVFRSEDGVARRLGKLANEGEVDRALRHHVGPVSRGAGQ